MMSDNTLSVFGIACLTLCFVISAWLGVDGTLRNALVASIVACVTYKVAKRKGK